MVSAIFLQMIWRLQLRELDGGLVMRRWKILFASAAPAIKISALTLIASSGCYVESNNQTLITKMDEVSQYWNASPRQMTSSVYSGQYETSSLKSDSGSIWQDSGSLQMEVRRKRQQIQLLRKRCITVESELHNGKQYLEKLQNQILEMEINRLKEVQNSVKAEETIQHYTISLEEVQKLRDQNKELKANSKAIWDQYTNFRNEAEKNVTLNQRKQMEDTIDRISQIKIGSQLEIEGSKVTINLKIPTQSLSSPQSAVSLELHSDHTTDENVHFSLQGILEKIQQEEASSQISIFIQDHQPILKQSSPDINSTCSGEGTEKILQVEMLGGTTIEFDETNSNIKELEQKLLQAEQDCLYLEDLIRQKDIEYAELKDVLNANNQTIAEITAKNIESNQCIQRLNSQLQSSSSSPNRLKSPRSRSSSNNFEIFTIEQESHLVDKGFLSPKSPTYNTIEFEDFEQIQVPPTEFPEYFPPHPTEFKSFEIFTLQMFIPIKEPPVIFIQPEPTPSIEITNEVYHHTIIHRPTVPIKEIMQKPVIEERKSPARGKGKFASRNPVNMKRQIKKESDDFFAEIEQEARVQKRLFGK